MLNKPLYLQSHLNFSKNLLYLVYFPLFIYCWDNIILFMKESCYLETLIHFYAERLIQFNLDSHYCQFPLESEVDWFHFQKQFPNSNLSYYSMANFHTKNYQNYEFSCFSFELLNFLTVNLIIKSLNDYPFDARDSIWIHFELSVILEFENSLNFI